MKRGLTIRFVLPSVSMTLTVNKMHLHTRYYCSVNIHTHILAALHNNIFILHIYYMYVFTYSTYTIKECNNTRLHYYRSTIIPLLLLLLVVGFYWRERINATLGKSPVPFFDFIVYTKKDGTTTLLSVFESTGCILG